MAPPDLGSRILVVLGRLRGSVTVDNIVLALADGGGRLWASRPQVERWLGDHPELVDHDGDGWIPRARSTVDTTPAPAAAEPAGSELALLRRELEIERAALRRQRSQIVTLQDQLEVALAAVERLKVPTGQRTGAWMSERAEFQEAIAKLTRELAAARAANAPSAALVELCGLLGCDEGGLVAAVHALRNAGRQRERARSRRTAKPVEPDISDLRDAHVLAPPAAADAPPVVRRPNQGRGGAERLAAAVAKLNERAPASATIDALASALGVSGVAVSLALKRYAHLVTVDRSAKPFRISLRPVAA